MTINQLTREGLIERIANSLMNSDTNAPNVIDRKYIASVYAEAVAIVDGKTAPIFINVTPDDANL
ncbi:hypothetical protein [Komagataeibacter oboediens]|uniref:hypothetical protein n=1 Tax=Komagataeibacter oboediens TaxID=65958 RepID=UPI000237E3C9|nr:hypothetical protein [Komagataeibacter oboediens]